MEVGARNLIIANVEATWIQELRHPHTFFTTVPPQVLINHLAKFGAGLNRPAGVEIILSLHKMWDNDPPVNQFIINMEDAQNGSDRANLPITDNMLAAFATHMLINSVSFPRDFPTCYGKPIMDQTWDAWKAFFKPLQAVLEHESAAATGKPYIFGTAAAGQQHHGIIHGVVSHGTPPGITEHLDSQFDVLASANTNINAALKQLTTATTNKYAEIKAVLDRLTAATPTGASTPAAAANIIAFPCTKKHTYDNQIWLLQSAIINK